MATKVASEEETFILLRRTPISELAEEYRVRMWEFYSNDALFAQWLEKHGWQQSEFFDAGKKYEQQFRGRHTADSLPGHL